MVDCYHFLDAFAVSTSATLAHAFRQVLIQAAIETGADLNLVDWQAHDFSFRGMSSHACAAVSAAGHLLSFTGTDSLVALDWIERYYGGDYVAASVPATEHSVMCAGISSIGELELFNRLLDFYPKGIVSVVSDTFDLWFVLTDILPKLKEKIMNRNGKLVIRPDSGDPVDILCGTLTKQDSRFSDQNRNPAEKGVIELLWEHFGGTINFKGFKELDSHIGAIYGDSITKERAQLIINRLKDKQFSSGNIVFGIGSFTYQYNTRDTFASAIKATWAKVNGKGVDLSKNPVTDNGLKKSATGRLAVLKNQQGELYLIERANDKEENELSELKTVWENGKFIRYQSFSDVRSILNSR